MCLHRTVPTSSRPATVIEVCGEPVLTLAAPDPACARIEVGLVLAPLERTVDVTAHPAAASTAVRAAARRHGLGEAEAVAAAGAQVREAAAAAGAWAAPADASIEAALGGAGYPLLAAAYRGGAAPVQEVPRWAVPVLRQPTARAAAVEAFGAAATRPVIAALGSRFTDPVGGAVPLLPVGLGLIGRDALPPDRLARVLGAGGPIPGDGALLDRAAIASGRRAARRWGPVRTERVLTDAGVHERGGQLLLEVLRWAADLGDHAPGRLANRLVDLHGQYRSAMATDPGPAPRPPARPARRAAQHRHPARHEPVEERPPPDPRHRIFAPAAAGPVQVTAASVLPRPPELAALHHLELDGLRIVVPRTVGDLQRWSRLLANCLHDYGPVVVAGRSAILGVERAGTLHYALEVERGGRIRQFVGPANRPPDPVHRLAVVEALAAHAVVDRRLAANRVWFER